MSPYHPLAFRDRMRASGHGRARVPADGGHLPAYSAGSHVVVTMRGDWGEFNPWQVPMGQGTKPSLEAIGVTVTRADEPHLVASTVSGAAHLAFNTWRPTAVLIGQRVLGAKNFKELARK